MAKTVADVAIMLGALESPAPDPNDPATKTCMPPANRDYTPFLKADGLKGVRIGIPRAYYYDHVDLPGAAGRRAGGGFGNGLTPEQGRAMSEAIEILKQQGAIIIDPADIPSVVIKDPGKNFVLWGQCSGLTNVKGK